ncbi:MAG: hypothetical protein LBE09_00375 [Christensenellaceae bacterium]|nr:hypothetical protein [Christensenellaceae bacterium]
MNNSCNQFADTAISKALRQILLTCWNSEDIFDGSHIIAVSKSGNLYTSYNNASDASAHTHASLSDIISGKLIMGYIVG